MVFRETEDDRSQSGPAPRNLANQAARKLDVTRPFTLVRKEQPDRFLPGPVGAQGNRVLDAAIDRASNCPPAGVNSEASSISAPFEVTEPEVSKAIFAQLKGEAQYYRITSDVPFRFYAGITVPKIDGCPLDRRFSVDVLDKDLKLIVAADGERFDWWPWYESFGRKWYWVGPEIGSHFKSNRQLDAGTYYLRVFNAEQSGRYVLAIGDIESFPIDVIARTLVQMPGINHDFWDTVTCKGK